MSPSIKPVGLTSCSTTSTDAESEREAEAAETRKQNENGKWLESVLAQRDLVEETLTKKEEDRESLSKWW